MNKKAIIGLILLMPFLYANAATKKKEEKNFSVSKYIDIYSSLLRELNSFYVDSIDAEKLVNTSIESMLQELDPYTSYIPEEQNSDYKFMTTGEYGGIGSMITQNESGQIVISEPYEGFPAHKSGLMAGDLLMEIDGQKTKGKTVSEVSSLLKGQAGTSVKVEIFRPFADKTIKKEITREQIQIHPVSYYGVVGDKIGYIYLNQFTDKAADEVKKAFLELKEKHQITSLVFDLRNNPGGLLDQASLITNIFIPKGQEVVVTKGKAKQWDNTYKTTEEPLDINMPLVILVNNNTASASEIVSGALQDLDRAVIIGTRTYGKGLVQSTREVAYNGHIKLTTAKYYIPSGRCIQAIDYAKRNEDGSLERIPDSLTKEFKTRAGRTVRDGAGISPDIEVKNETKMNIAYHLYQKNIIFDYATKYASTHKKIDSPETFKLTEAEFQEFKAFINEKEFKYELKSAEYLKKLKEVVEFEGYTEISKTEMDALEAKLMSKSERDIDIFRKDVEDLLTIEIIKRYYFQKGEIRYTLRNDPELKKALEILSSGTDEYNALLKPKVQ